MQILFSNSFKRSTWKNGGGISHEVARDREGDSFGWRISIAEVSSDGPFSLFPGYRRCLTVISGNGMELRRPSGSQDARLFEPVWFSGDEAISGKLNNGPCLDFNVIFDPSRFAAELEVLVDPQHPVHGRANFWTALYLLKTPPSPDPDDLIVLDGPDDEFRPPEKSKAILLRLSTQAI
jgi:environmental stress-induced protein Ves